MSNSTTTQATMTDSTTPVTMTSLELVDFINDQREKGEAKLAHHVFLKQVRLVFGRAALKFQGSYKDSMNRDKPCYVFPKYEACLMASSHSDELKTKVFDHMTELEDKQAIPALPTDPSLAEVVTALYKVDALAKELAAIKQQQSAIQQRVLELEAKANASHTEFYTVEGYAALKGIKLSIAQVSAIGREAGRFSRDSGIQIGKEPSAKYGIANTYHIDVLEELFQSI